MAQLNAKFNQRFQMDLSETQKVNGKDKHVKVATVAVPFPTLTEFGISAKQAVFTQDDVTKGNYAPGVAVVGQPKHEDGVPVYEDTIMDWLQQAIVGKVAAYSRNRFKKGVLKPGMSLAEDFEALTAETQRTGEALALRREAKASFEAYLSGKLNKKASTVGLLGDLFFNSAKVLQSAGDKYIEALGSYTGDWLDTLTDEQKTRFAPKIEELQNSINAATTKEALDDEDILPVKKAA